MKKIRLIVISVVILLGGISVVWLSQRSKSGDTEEVRIEEGRIVDLRPIAELCSMEIYREVAVRDTLNGKVLFGIQKQQGRITFDLSGLPKQIARSVSDKSQTALDDTISLILPVEKVEIAESTVKDSWRVIDSKSLKLFGSSKLSTDEENAVKRKAIERSRRQLYSDGTVAKARQEAAFTLKRMTEQLTGRPVKVNY